MFNGKLKTIVDTKKLNISLLKNAVSFFKDKEVVCNLHDGSPIRKPESKKLDSIGKVKSLGNKLVNGYETFNSVMIDVAGASIQLLGCVPYSNGASNFVSVSERKAYETGQLKDKARREAIAAYDKTGESFNQKDIVFKQLRSINTKIKAENPSITLIDIFDRGFDDVALFELQGELGNEFIVRGKANRTGEELYLDDKGKERAVRLIRQNYRHGEDVYYDRIKFRNKVYKKVRGVFEWNTLELNGNIYSVLRVGFYKQNSQAIFKDPMLLITSLSIDSIYMANSVWELYMQRGKIEAVFKFCKQELNWEAPRIDDWTTMQNLLSLVYFIAGYFYEIEHELVQDPTAQWLAKLGDGKGKVTVHFLLKGLAKIIAYLEIQQLIDNQKLRQDDIKKAARHYLAKKNL